MSAAESVAGPAARSRGIPGLFLLPACYLVETILGGPLGVYGGLPVRYVLFSLCCAVLALALLVRGRVSGRLLPAIGSITGFLLANAVWVVVVPVLAGGKFTYALSEARAFVALVIAVLALAVVRSGDAPELIRRMQLTVVAAAAVLALAQFVIWVVGTLFGDLQWAIQLGLVWLYSGAEDLLYVGLMPDGFFRVFWISSLWCLLALFWVPVVRHRWVRALLRLVLSLGLLVTYSRGIWLGAIAGLLAVQAAQLTVPRLARIVARTAAATAMIAAIAAGALAATGELERGLARFTSTASVEDDGVSIRLEQAHYLSQVWAEHQLFGGGYGAYHPRYQRSQEAPFSYEHMPYAFLAKLGLVGVLVNGLFLLSWALDAWRARLRDPAPAAFLGGLVSFLVSAMTNPMIINVVGMTILGCLVLQWAGIHAASADVDEAHGA